MASTRIKNMARAIQHANPGMKYTEALRHAEAGRIVINPMASPIEAVIEVYRAAGIASTPIDLSAPRGTEPLDPLKIAAPTEYLDRSPRLWGGSVHPDFLTFLVGYDLDAGEEHYLTLRGLDSHLLISGDTASGKTNLAEIIMAQFLLKPMPWDPALFGTVMIVDSKGPLALKWAGRPGVISANGQMDSVETDEEGNPLRGNHVVGAALEWIEDEYLRRVTLMEREKASSWLDLPDETKRNERLAPMLVVLDEPPLHSTEHPDKNEVKLQRETMAVAAQRSIRKYRVAGMHVITISPLATHRTGFLPLGAMPHHHAVKAVAGHASDWQMRAIFETQDVLELPISRADRRQGATTGYVRIASSSDQETTMIRVPWFGGSRNSDTLDKWLPQGECPPNGDFTPAPRTPREKS